MTLQFSTPVFGVALDRLGCLVEPVPLRRLLLGLVDRKMILFCLCVEGGGGGKFFWQMLFATSFSLPVFTTDYENQREICYKPKFNFPMASKMWPPANLRIFFVCTVYHSTRNSAFKNA